MYAMYMLLARCAHEYMTTFTLISIKLHNDCGTDDMGILAKVLVGREQCQPLRNENNH